MGFLSRLFGHDNAPDMEPLYLAVVKRARQPEWYVDGQIPDTLDGRFDVLALVLSLVLLRIEREGEPGRLPAARLAERFVSDMDGQLRQTGFGDLVVGKQVGYAMAALGGRLGAYRAFDGGVVPDDALVRNLWRDVAPPADALLAVRAMVADLKGDIDTIAIDAVLRGAI
jgi:cytochrome b pre-mRNA-processing protein 3